MQKSVGDIHDIVSEAGILATLINNPTMFWSNEDLKHTHFSDMTNGCVYLAISGLVQKNIGTIDVYNIMNELSSNPQAKGMQNYVTTEALSRLIDVSDSISRSTAEEYNNLAKSVIEKSLRRDVYAKLKQCEGMCFDDTVENVSSEIYKTIEDVLCEYQGLEEIDTLGNDIDDIWLSIENNAIGDNFEDFKFPSLNEFCKISRTDCITFAAREKRGKSIMLLNCAVDLLKKGKRVLYIDTELDTRLFTMRLISHMTQIRFRDIRDGTFPHTEREAIDAAIGWIKDQMLIHVYMPVVEDDKILSMVKRVKHKYGLDVVILDYLKGNGDHTLDAYRNSASLGKTTDLLKNIIAGKENLYVLCAVQATSSGGIADSAKIARNSSAVIYLDRKTQEEIDKDGGLQFGNMKLSVTANRNGNLHYENEYISLYLDGDRCTFLESEQPKKDLPY